ncbi:MAG: hypothetical protein IJQ93_01645 [Bacteroidales bacterium]|nr:hypothetical protein [Bacteroidales bacterium]
MLLTVFIAIAFCSAITLMLLSAVVFVQDKKFFSSAPKEAQEVLRPRTEELFYGARKIGWVLMVISTLTILGVCVISVWDGLRSGFTFSQFFTRFVVILTAYKAFDMIFIDWFLLCRFRFFQHFYPEVESVFDGRTYGFNLKSQLLKLLVIFPAASALAAWVCTIV